MLHGLNSFQVSWQINAGCQKIYRCFSTVNFMSVILESGCPGKTKARLQESGWQRHIRANCSLGAMNMEMHRKHDKLTQTYVRMFNYALHSHACACLPSSSISNKCGQSNHLAIVLRHGENVKSACIFAGIEVTAIVDPYTELAAFRLKKHQSGKHALKWKNVTIFPSYKAMLDSKVGLQVCLRQPCHAVAICLRKLHPAKPLEPGMHWSAIVAGSCRLVQAQCAHWLLSGA